MVHIYREVRLLLSGTESNFTEFCVCCWAVYRLTVQSCVSVVDGYIVQLYRILCLLLGGI